MKRPSIVETAEGHRLARFFAATWQRAIQEHFQLTLPEALTKSWSPDVTAVTLIGFVDTLEIWTPSAWAEEVARTARDYEALLDPVLDPSEE